MSVHGIDASRAEPWPPLDEQNLDIIKERFGRTDVEFDYVFRCVTCELVYIKLPDSCSECLDNEGFTIHKRVKVTKPLVGLSASFVFPEEEDL